MGTPEADEEAFLNMFKRREGEAAPDWVLPTEGLLEAMESVPLFMTQSPTDNVEGNPTLAALQSLLYEDTPEEIALTFLGNAQEVIENYEKTGRQHKILLENAMNFLKNALEQSHENKGLKGKIYYQLGRIQFLKANYGRSREAFTKSLEVDPQEETKRHLALVFEALEKYEEAILLLTELSDESIQRENLCRVQAKMHEQVTRRRKIALESKFKEDVLSKRHLSVQKEDITLLNAYIPAEYIRDLPSWTFHPKDDELLLPMVFLYPPYGTFDILGQVSEYTFVLDHLEGMFEGKAPWDSKNLYTSSRGFRTFIPLVGANPNEILEVQKEMTFHEIFLKTKRANLFCGVFLLLVFPKDGATEDLSFFKITT